MLLKLNDDPKPKVKGKALKYLKEINNKIKAKEISVNQAMEYKIKNTLSQETLKKEWII